MRSDGAVREHKAHEAEGGSTYSFRCDGSGRAPQSERIVPAQRHTGWESVSQFRVAGAGRRTYVVTLGDRCRIQGFGRGGAVGGGWHVVSAERNVATNKINVEVNRDGRTRIVEHTRVVYQRQRVDR